MVLITSADAFIGVTPENRLSCFGRHGGADGPPTGDPIPGTGGD